MSSVADELFVVGQEEASAARVKGGAALGRVSVDDRGRRVAEHLPLAKPLRLERGGDDEEATTDATRAPEGVAGGDGLGRLPQAHVVGEEETAPPQEPLDGLALIGVERLLESPKRLA